MWPTARRQNTFFQTSGSPRDESPASSVPPSTDSVLTPPAVRNDWKALLRYAALVFFSAGFALFLAEATDPIRGFMPFVVDPPPAHSEPRGFEASLGVSRLYAREAEPTPQPLVPNSGETYAYAPTEGIASWYGYDHIGRKTADGGWFDPEAMTAAHRSLPFGSVVRVTRLDTGKSVEVTINDRGPYVKGRIIDLSRRPASELGLYDKGIAECRIEVLKYPLKRRPNSSSSSDSSEKAPMKEADPDLKVLISSGS